jgi:predicted RNA-binding Zn ribbon-like protein
LLVTPGSPVPARQPGGRSPAPGELALVQEFLNSRWDLDRDLREQLESPAALTTWLLDRGLLEPRRRVNRAGLQRALDLREGLQALCFANNESPVDAQAVERMNVALRGPGVFVQFGVDERPSFTQLRRDLDGALALIATIVAVAQTDGRWARLKACPGSHCGWAFYDHSRNQAGSWCSMSVCGSRAKAREYRKRRRQDERSTE